MTRELTINGTTTLAGIAVLAAAALAGCGAAATTSATGPGSAPQAVTSAPAGRPASPVTIIRQAGATTQEVYGQADVYGDRYANGSLPGTTVPGCGSSWNQDPGGTCLEAVQVYTFSTQADQVRYEQQNGTPHDGQVMVSGHLFTVIVGGEQKYDGTWVFPVPPATIAARVHGTIARPSS